MTATLRTPRRGTLCAQRPHSRTCWCGTWSWGEGRPQWAAGSTSSTKTPPASELIKKAAGVQKGSGEPHKVKAGKLTKDQVREIAETKMPDLNANDIDAAMKIIAGTARQMGIDTEL